MPADGSQYLVTETRSSTSRGDTSSTVHTQTVTYNNVLDEVVRNLSNDKVTESIQEAHDQDTIYNDQTDRATTVLAANKVQVADQAQLTGGTGSAIVKGPRAIQVSFTVDMLGTTVFC